MQSKREGNFKDNFCVRKCSLSVLGFDMADVTQIEWTDSTWNPVTGCSKITAGCDFCYAERFSERFRGVDGHPFAGVPRQHL
jgi:Protein of unknown function (DUF5131)